MPDPINPVAIYLVEATWQCTGEFPYYTPLGSARLIPEEQQTHIRYEVSPLGQPTAQATHWRQVRWMLWHPGQPLPATLPTLISRVETTMLSSRWQAWHRHAVPTLLGYITKPAAPPDPANPYHAQALDLTQTWHPTLDQARAWLSATE